MPMYITSVLSNFGAWRKLNDERPVVVQAIREALATIELEPVSQSDTRRPKDRLDATRQSVDQTFTRWMRQHNHSTNVHIQGAVTSKSSRISLDAVVARVGVEMTFGGWSDVVGSIFIRFPLAIQAKMIDIAVVLVPEADLTRPRFNGRATHFASIRDLLSNVPPGLKYPFLVIGFSDREQEPEVSEITSELDQYLIDTVGLTLEEMLRVHERPNYDFKQDLSETFKIRKSICALSNHKNGGVFLFGIADGTSLPGIPWGQPLDNIKRGFDGMIAGADLKPEPRYHHREYTNPGNDQTCLLVVRVEPADVQPCTLDDKVYYRHGASSRLATPEQIRRIVLE